MISLNIENAFSRISKSDFEAQAQQLETFSAQVKERNQGFSSILDDENILTQIENFHKNLDPKIESFVILGIGGSSLGFDAILQAIPSPKGKNFFILNNSDPEKIFEIENQIDLAKTLFLVITKSGKTPETMAQFFYFQEKVLNKKLVQSSHFVFVTDSDSFLHQLSKKESIPCFEIPSNVGGRFSVLTAVGLLPSKILGLNIRKFINGAKKVRTQFLSKNFSQNLPFQLASLQFLHQKQQIMQNVLFPYAGNMKGVGEWFIQLISESTGKTNTAGKSVGITPLCAVGAKDQHSILQLFSDGPKDKLFLFLEIESFRQNMHIGTSPCLELTDFAFLKDKTFGELLHAEFEGTQKALTEKDCPNITIKIPQINEESLGALFFLFEASTAFLGEFLNINVFNQPGVERSKILTKEILEK